MEYERTNLYAKRHVLVCFRMRYELPEPDDYTEHAEFADNICLYFLYLERERSDVFAERNLLERIRLSDEYP